jgi:thiol-disulfide isomerase/thioredoxin
MDWGKLIVIYGPHSAAVAMVVAVLYLVWTIRRNRPILPASLVPWVTVWLPERYRAVLPQSISGWVKLLAVLVAVALFREQLYGIHFIPMTMGAVFWLLWISRRKGDFMPLLSGWGWLKVMVALGVIAVSQGYIHELRFLKTVERNLSFLYDRPAPDIQFVRIDDESVQRLSDFRGRVVLLHFWRPSCGSCMKHMVDLDRLQDQYGNDGLSVINLSMGENLWSLNAAVDVDSTAMVHGVFDGLFGELAVGIPPPDGVRRNAGIPLVVIIDRDGTVRQTYSGGPRSYEYFLVGAVPYL